MDVDVPSVEQNEDLIGYFALRAEDFAWNADTVEQIRARRDAMSGELFFDILLKLGGIEQPASLYPPVDVTSLQRLLDAIESVTYDTMKRDCLIYYLLRWQMDGRESTFAEEKVISPHYVSLADSYWFLDLNTNLGGAIGLLSDARIVKDYTSKIIETLALSAESGHLIRKFVRTCKPALREQSDLERYLIATAEFSMVEAWQYQKTFPEDQTVRRKLIQRLLVWAFTPKPRQQALTQLLPLPFSKYEETVVQEFAKNPPDSLPSPSISIVRDMVCVRLILSCKYSEAVKFDRQYPSSGASARGTWGAERQRIMAEVISVMPAAERVLLEEELVDLPASSSRRSNMSSAGSGGSTNLNTSTASLATDLSSSWEDVGGRRGSRQSLGGRAVPARTPRHSMTNGFAPSPPQPNLFIPGSSTSTPRAPQSLSAHPTLISQGASMPSMSTPSETFSSSVFSSSIAAQSSTPSRISTQRPPSAALAPTAVPKITVNGTNGTPKTNAFTSRNAFFNPPEAEEPPERPRLNGNSKKAPEPLKKTLPQRPDIRLPTPPQEEEGSEQLRRSESVRDDSHSVNGDDGEQSAASEREDLGFSIFGNPTSSNREPRPKPSSPQRMRKTRSSSAKISVPGAFFSDEESTQDLLSPKSAKRITPAAEESISARTRRSNTNTKNSRKRTMSPETSVDDIRLSIPGTLYEEDEYSQNGDLSREHAGGDERDEEADELTPLPPSAAGGRRKTTSATGSSKRRTSRATSRASSAEPEETGPVRRSSRLSSTGSMTAMEKVEKTEKKNTRPRKSTRTAGAGATATGKGAAKRK